MTTPNSMPTLGAVIVAGGSSRRMGFDKILTPLAREPLIRHSVRAFEFCPVVQEIVVVCAKERESKLRAVLKDAHKIAAIVLGGMARQDSVWNGLEALSTEFVAVHDAARPLVSSELISRCFEAAIEHGASAAAEPVTDTLQRIDEKGHCMEVVDRRDLWHMQTPQVFRTADLRKAMQDSRAEDIKMTDETSAFRRQGGQAFLVENTDWNFKVTYPRDVAVAEFILQARAAASLT